MRSAAIVSTSPNPPVVPLHFIHLIARADADVVRSLLALVCCGLCGRALAQPAFAQFEARQTHPIGLTPSGGRLLALNSPDGRLSVFDVTSPVDVEPVLVAEIPVGLEPVSLRARTDDEVWVVNEVSDSVSVVSLQLGTVVATLPCPDEPADVVFAQGKAFVSCARNGLLRVFDTATRAEVATIPLNGLYPRSLATDAAGTRVFVAFQLSGNRTTVLPADKAPAPPAPTNPDLPAPPRTALIVSASDVRVPYTVLDHDVAEVSVEGLRVLGYFSDAGTSLFDLAVRPGTDELWVANTDARNLTRFEPDLRGHLADNRVTRLDLSSGGAVPFDLDAGIDHALLPNPAAQAGALAQPTAIAFSADGSAAWVAAFGSDRVARLDPADGRITARVDVRPALADGSRGMRGPRGIALNEAHRRLYVLNKLANTISIIATDRAVLLGEVPAGSFDPTPAAVKAGRGFLFDARLSGNGTASCATCHLDADRDGLAWDLGDPGGTMTTVIGADLASHDTRPQARAMHPMKGPMVTQTLRGIGPTNLFHWRGDRATLRDFNPTFRDLMGGALLPDADMDALKTYLATLRHHPNPDRGLDNSLPVSSDGGDARRGRSRFNVHINHCAVCHTGASGSDNNVDDLRNFGGRQPMKTPSLQTTYQRAVLDTRAGAVNVAGFGLLHDGTGGTRSLPTAHFYELDELGGQDFADVTAYVRSFDTGTAPAVGWNRTVSAATKASAALDAELTVLEAQARGTNTCDLVAHGRVGGSARQFRYDAATQRYRPDRAAEAPMTRAGLLAALGADDALTFLGVLPGDGPRRGGDRDGDGVPDGDEPAPTLTFAASREGLDLAWPVGTLDWLLESAPGPTGPWLPDLRPREKGAAIRRIPPAGFPEPAQQFRLRRVW